MDGQLKDAEIVNNRTFDELAYEASDNSYVKVDNGGSVTFTAKEGADGLTMRYSIKDGDKGEVKVYVNGEPMRTFHLDSNSAYQYVDGSNVYDTKATDHSHARFSFDEVHGFFGVHVNPGDTVTIENNGVELALDFVELEMSLHLSLNQKIVFQSQIQSMVQKMVKIVQLRLKKR